MCGIAGFHRRNGKPIAKAQDLADHLLLEIEERGRHATGSAAIYEKIEGRLQRMAAPAAEFVLTRAPFSAAPKTVLLHTRYATSGNRDSVKDAHPVRSGAVLATHNGHISNADHLFTRYGLPRECQVDSEVIPAMVSRFGWDRMPEALGHLQGGAAVAIVDMRQRGHVVLARLDTYPLVFGVTGNVIIWASQIKHINGAWGSTYGEDFPGEFTVLEEGDIYTLTPTGEITKARVQQPKPKTIVVSSEAFRRMRYDGIRTWSRK